VENVWEDSFCFFGKKNEAERVVRMNKKEEEEEVVELEGPFELHVVIELSDEPLLQRWLLGNNTGPWVNPKLTGFCAFYGEHPIHLMLSCFLRGSVGWAISQMDIIVSSFSEAKIRILRVKLEASLGAAGVPKNVVGDQYYEVHIKVPVGSAHTWDALAAMCKPFNAHLFINNRSKSQVFAARKEAVQGGVYAIVTARRYNTAFGAAFDAFQELQAAIEKAFGVESVRKEYSFYDTNPNPDRGWLCVNDAHEHDDVIGPEEK
jgi:hypothetical protein